MAVFWSLDKTRMSQSLKELISLFELKKINFDTANRKTLDNWIKKIQLQKRRQLLFESSCERFKKKSRVALCKKTKQGRPGFSQELGTLGTKKLRQVIKSFLKEIGLDNFGNLEKKSDKDLQKLALVNKWETVLFMSDQNVEEVETDEEEEKRGGMFQSPEPKKKKRHRRASSLPPSASRRGRSRSPALRLFDGSRGRQARGPRGRPRVINLTSSENSPVRPAQPPATVAYGSPGKATGKTEEKKKI